MAEVSISDEQGVAEGTPINVPWNRVLSGRPIAGWTASTARLRLENDRLSFVIKAMVGAVIGTLPRSVKLQKVKTGARSKMRQQDFGNETSNFHIGDIAYLNDAYSKMSRRFRPVIIVDKSWVTGKLRYAVRNKVAAGAEYWWTDPECLSPVPVAKGVSPAHQRRYRERAERKKARERAKQEKSSGYKSPGGNRAG